MKKTRFLAWLVLLFAGSLPGLAAAVEVEQLRCLEVEQNGVVRATVVDDIPGGEVRLYFRRLHEEVEDFYWVRMHPSGAGSYWALFPKPEDEILERREFDDLESRDEDRYEWAWWWRQKEIEDDRDPNDDLDRERIEERASIGRSQARDWMELIDDETFEDWLEELENEPAEYFVALFDGFGNPVARSALMVVEVRESCDADLTPMEASLADSLIIGETAPWQVGEQPFHWLCDGIVSRVDRDGFWRGDGVCRACLIAWWQKNSFLIPLASLSGGTGIITVDDDDDESPFRP